MQLRAFILIGHRWLGLATSAVLSVVGLTGALMVCCPKNRFAHIAGRLHEGTMFGQPGVVLVELSTYAATAIVLGGLILWWKRRIVTVRAVASYRRTIFDLHHSVGLFGFLIMFILAASAVGMMITTPDGGPLRKLIMNLHTARAYPVPVKIAYMLAAAAFAVQAVSGVLMWWKPKRKGQASGH